MRLQDSYLGRQTLPPEISDHDIETYFSCTEAELADIRGFNTKGQFSAALYLGFLRFTGSRLDGVNVAPRRLLVHIANQLGHPKPPDIATLKAMHGSKATRSRHFAWAMGRLGWRIPDPRADDRRLNDYLVGIAPSVPTRNELVGFARRWMYDQKLVMPAERALVERCSRIHANCEEGLFEALKREVSVEQRKDWLNKLLERRGEGRMTYLEWLQAPLKKRSKATMDEQFEKIEFLKSIGVDNADLSMLPYERQLSYYRKMQNRKPSMINRITETSRHLEVVCFLSCCLRRGTDIALNLVAWSTTDIFRKSRAQVAAAQAAKAADFRAAVAQINQLTIPEYTSFEQVKEIRLEVQKIVMPLLLHVTKTKAELERETTLDQFVQATRLVNHLVELDVHGEHGTMANDALKFLKDSVNRKTKELGPDEKVRVRDKWNTLVNEQEDPKSRFKAATIASLAEFSRGVRRGDLWIDHSETYRYRKELLISEESWKVQRHRHYTAYNLPRSAEEFLQRHLKNLEEGLAAMAEAYHGGDFKISSDRLSIAPLEKEPEIEGSAAFEATLDDLIGSIQLPELLLKIDAKTLFSRPLLGGRPPYDANELLAVYGGLLASGSDMTAKGIEMMTPGLTAAQISTMMNMTQSAAQLRAANDLVTEYMMQFPYVKYLGPGNWCSADAVSLETTKHLYSARLEPRKRVPATGMYSHILDRYAMVYDQPMIINRRQAGHAIEGALRQQTTEVELVSVDTHGYTHFGMGISKLMRLDLCPRLKDLKERRLIVPTGTKVPECLLPVTDFISIRALLKNENYDALVHIAASIADGTVSAPVALHRFGHASKGDPVYEAGVQLGMILRTIFFCDYYTKPRFRRELHRVLNRGEAVHTLNRAIHSGRMPHFKGRTEDELIAVSGSLRLLSNIVMAWSVEATQAALDQLKREGITPNPEILAHIGPIRFSAVNFRGMLNFPLERYAPQIIGAPVRDRSAKVRQELRPRRKSKSQQCATKEDGAGD